MKREQSYGRDKNLDKLKNIAGQILTQFKEISLTKQKTWPRIDYEWIRKTIYSKNQIQKNPKIPDINLEMPHVNKNTSEKANFCSNTVFS